MKNVTSEPIVPSANIQYNAVLPQNKITMAIMILAMQSRGDFLLRNILIFTLIDYLRLYSPLSTQTSTQRFHAIKINQSCLPDKTMGSSQNIVLVDKSTATK